MTIKNAAIIIIASIGIVGFLFLFIQKKEPSDKVPRNEATPTPFVTIDKKSGLTTYQSSNGKFSMQYPNDFDLHVNEVRVQHSNTFHHVANVIELDSPHVGRNPYVLVQYGENMTNQTVEEYIENSSECGEVEDQKGDPIEVSHVSARVYFDILCNSGGETRVYITKGMMQYTIVFAQKPVDRGFVMKFISNFTIL